ncbi:MAG: hypothetical protein EA420_00405 [Candidatus Competibacteraceae bacterium]|nr:MAG: hypothetical protein EA420_00405 [Candidatus Competibacteraceae bacterium]
MTLPRSLSRLAWTSVLLALPAATLADTGTLTLFADGEELATEGFVAPKLTRDGWELRFDRILITLDQVTAHQTEPPYDADSGAAIDAQVSVPLVTEPVTVDLVNVDDSGRVTVATATAPAGFYNALSYDLRPGADGATMVLSGTARREGTEVAFTLSTDTALRHRCGEFVGDERKGFLTAGGETSLDITLHLDHLFGRADQPADDEMNQEALGFDRFSAGGTQRFSLDGLHVGHVGEGHCHVEAL